MERGSLFWFGELLVTSETRAQEHPFQKKGVLTLVLSEPVCQEPRQTPSTDWEKRGTRVCRQGRVLPANRRYPV